MLGLDPMPKRTPLRAQITGVLERPGQRIEKIVFQSMPGLYVTGNLYVPRKPSGALPTILYACGHSPHPLGAKQDYQDRALWFVSHGYVCLVLDTLEFGEVAGLHHGMHDLNLWNWVSLGYTPVGVEVWNAIRALDYLETRPEVDRKRIGMTGISGGGAVTWYTAALDERIAAAAPVCSTYTFGSQAAHWVAAGQCDCIYFHNTFLRDFPMVGALIAPRPLLICSGRRDVDFPPDGYHEVFRRVKGAYALYAGSGSSDRVMEVDDDVGHADAPRLRKAVREWMNRWLKDDTVPLVVEPADETKPETAEDLACLSRLPSDAINYHIHDAFIPTARPKTPASLAQWQERRREVVTQLRDKVFRWFPAAKVPFETKVTSSDGGWAARYADYKEVVFTSELGVPIRAQLLRPRDRPPEPPLLIHVKRAGDSIYPLDLDELLPVLGRYTVLILNPRLTEHPVSAFEYAEIERTASWTGRSIAAMQVWDILRAVAWAIEEERISPPSVSVYGKGEAGILGLYAGLFEERITRLVLGGPPASHWQGPALLNVLRITDIPEVAGALAPRHLSFLGKVPRAFAFTRKVYQLYGQEARLESAASLAEALQVWRYPARVGGAEAQDGPAPRGTGS
jgi:dienelactone hydrolase